MNCKRIRGRTKSAIPVLSRFGEYAICDNVMRYETLGKRCELYYFVKIYDTEFQLKINNWTYYGSILKIYDDNIDECFTAYNSKVLCRTVNSELIKSKKTHGFTVYSTTGTSSDKCLRMITHYRNWLESNVCAYFSYIYAMVFSQGVLEIVFWDPEPEPEEVISDILLEALEVLK